MLTRDLLREMGLEEDQVDKIMKENGKSIQEANDLRDRIKELEEETSQLAQKDEQIQDLQGRLEDLSQRLEDTNKASRTTQNELALVNAGADRDYIDLLQKELQGVEEDELSETIKSLQERLPKLFESNEPADPSDYRVQDNKLTQGQEDSEWTAAKIMEVDDTSKRQQLIAEHSDLF